VPRRYDQFCALARSLDVVGERWTLLLVRELLLGPKRFTELLRALPGIGRNLLAARLRELEEAGVVEHGGQSYGLTERGRALEDPVLALTRWQLTAMAPPGPEDERRAGWYALAMWAAFRPERAPSGDEAYEFRVDGEPFHLEVANGHPRARHGSHPAPAVVLSAGLDTFLLIAIGALTPGDAEAGGRAQVEGSRAALRRALRAFGLPAPVPAAPAARLTAPSRA
jgi:DNA-binding HxlR family transcriptional regulator